MSAGLLQRLAERSLGLARPLRSRIAVRAGGPASPAAFEPDELDQVTPAWNGAPSSPMPAWRERRPAVVHAALAFDAIEQHQDVSPPAQPSSRAGIAPGAKANHPRAKKVQAGPSDELVSNDDRRSNASWPGRVEPTSAIRSIPASTPAPLLPLQPPRWSFVAPDPPDSQSTPRRAQRATDGPNEVHVSIGRVELTAIAPKLHIAKRAPAAKPATRSLEDYLRPRDKGQA